MASGGEEKVVKKKEILQVDEAFRQLVIDNFWSITEKKKKSQLAEMKKAQPLNFHTWGKSNKILEKSPTLRELTKRKTISTDGLDCPGTLHNILDELNLPYSIKSIPTIKNDKEVLIYDIDCDPKICFRGIGRSKEEAQNRAATFGLNYYCILGK